MKLDVFSGAVQHRWLYRLVAILLKVYCSTLRMNIVGVSPEFFEKDRKPVLIALWHNRLAAMLFGRQRYIPQRAIAAMVSASKDGEILSNLLVHFGIPTARGSSSRKGSEALRQMVSFVRDGKDSVITVDGPRGPKYHVHPGIIALAQITQAPIYPVSCQLSAKFVCKSWDNFMIPFPFSRIEFVCGMPITVPDKLNDEELEVFRQDLSKQLSTLTNDA